VTSLDYGKRNLNSTCETIRTLQDFVSCVSELNDLVQKKHYVRIASILTNANAIKKSFQQYRDIRRVEKLFDQLDKIETMLKKVILQDFESWDKLKERTNASGGDSSPEKLLSDACQVVDAIGESFREQVIQQFTKQNISLYKMIYSQKKKSSLDVVDKRFTWMRKLLNTYAQKFAQIFPDYWCVREELVVDFCLATREDITNILTQYASSLDAPVLYRAILQTSKFEREMHDMFHVRSEADVQKEVETKQEQVIEEIQDLSKIEAKTPDEIKRLFKLRVKLRELERKAQQQKTIKDLVEEKPKKPRNSYNFLGFISTAFDDHMDSYVRYEESQLKEAFDKMARKERWNGEGETKSHEDLLMFITSSMKSCTAFSKGKVLLKLVNEVWRKYVDKYATLMSNSLPRVHVPQSKEVGSIDLNKWIQLNDKENATTRARLSESEESVVCYMIHVAMFWQNNLSDLQEDLRSNMEEAYASQVNFSDEVSKFYVITRAAIEQLVYNLMAVLEDEFTKMQRMPVATMIEVGDQSEYMHSIISLLSDAFPYLAEKIPTTNYKTLCDNFSSMIFTHFQNIVYRYKRINGPGTQQLLLDVTSLTAFLKLILNLGDPERFDEDEVLSFAKKVQQRAAKVECILKVMLAPPEALVETYKGLIQNGSVQDLQVIMELQGLPKNERNAIIEDYNQNKKKSIVGATTGALMGGVTDISNKTKEISQHTNKMVADSFSKMKKLTTFDF